MFHHSNQTEVEKLLSLEIFKYARTPNPQDYTLMLDHLLTKVKKFALEDYE